MNGRLDTPFEWVAFVALILVLGVLVLAVSMMFVCMAVDTWRNTFQKRP